MFSQNLFFTAETLASVNEIGNSCSKENGSEEDVTPCLLVFILIPVICLMLILILIVVLIIVMHKKRSRKSHNKYASRNTLFSF